MKRAMLFLTLAFSSLGFANAQWSDNPDTNLRLNNESFYSFETELLSDDSWYLYYNRPDGSIDTIVPFLQRFDKDGNPLWEEPLTISRQLTASWTKVMDCMSIDKDDNAIVVVQDKRHGAETYTAYKITPDGTSVWAEGVDLHSGVYPDGCAALNMTQIADGSYIFAWQEYLYEDVNTGMIRLQRVSADGQLLWGEGKLIQEENVPMSYPYVLDANNNEFLLVYAYGASQEIQVRKMDFDGNDIWAQPATAFDGISSSIPLWTFLSVVPADGGVLIGTYEGDPNFPYVSYVKADGTHAFAEGSAGLRLGYSEWLAWGVQLAFDQENQAIYAVWRETDYNQQYSQIVTQKVSIEGELLWDPNGIAVTQFLPRPVSYYDAEIGPKGSLFVSYMEQYDLDNNGLGANDPVNALAVLQSAEGDFVWEDTAVMVSGFPSVKYNMEALPLSNDQWILVWEDVRDVEGGDGGYLYGQNITVNGLLGVQEETPNANESRQESRDEAFRVVPNPILDNAILYIENGAGVACKAEVELWNLNGAKAGEIYNGRLHEGMNRIEWNRPSGLSGGFYLLKATVGDRTQFAKIILR